MLKVLCFLFLFNQILAQEVGLFDGENLERKVFIFDIHTSPKVPYSRPIIELKIGSPPVTFRAYLTDSETGILFVDKKCGERRTDCAKYCKDEVFSKMYCHPLCRFVTEQNIQSICGRTNTRYDPNASNTSYQMNKEFSAHYPNRRPIIGRFVLDQLQITGLDGRHFMAPNITFISGLSMDIRFFETPHLEADAMFGISPANNSIVRWAFNHGMLQKPLLTLAFYHSRATLGEFDQHRCFSHTLIYYPIVHSNYWSIEVDAFKVNGIEKLGKTKLIVESDIFGSGIPESVAKTYFRENLMRISNEGLQLKCGVLIKIDFQIRNRNYRWNLTSPIPDKDPNDWCLSNLWIVDNRYTDGATWQLGGSFLSSFCVVFNYFNNTLGLAEYRDPFI